MGLAALGLSHATAPVDVRERHAFPRERIAEALVAIRDYELVREATILSTCNRLEIYAELSDIDQGLEQLEEFLGNFRHAGLTYDLRPYLYRLRGEAVVEHLMRVSTGLDSLLLGDAQILGQVKEAYEIARESHTIGKTLHQLFREAIGAGKAARTHTSIGGESVSVATAAIAMACEHVGAPVGKNVLLIGAGKMGQIAAKRLKLEGASEIVVANRSQERAEELVRQLGIGRAADFETLGDALKPADVVITSTGASHFILTSANVTEAMRARPQRPLFIIDVAVPRDVDPAVERIPGVRVVNVDHIGEAIDATLENRRQSVPMVEKIVAERLAAYQAWSRTRSAAPALTSLTRKAESIRGAELDRLYSRLPTLSGRDRDLVANMSLRIVSKLLHGAMARLRDDAIGNHEEAALRTRLIDELFGDTPAGSGSHSPGQVS